MYLTLFRNKNLNSKKNVKDQIFTITATVDNLAQVGLAPQI